MNKAELTALLNRFSMRPGRGLGQNFLLDGNMLEWIARRAELQPGEEILEVGPGFGALTEKLLASGARVTAIEFDHRIAAYLRERFRDSANLRLVEADACRADFAELFPAGTPFRCVANLPYAISSVFLAKLLELENAPSYMLFMLQKEMGERLSAPSGCKAYGALTVRTQVKYDVAIAKIVPPTVFFPPPEVESALVEFRKQDRFPLEPPVWKNLNTVVKLLFSQRRKQMGRILQGGFDRELVGAALEQCNISPAERPDKLSVAQFVELAERLTRR